MTELIRLALIDDDEAVLDALSIYLLRKGISVTCFSGSEAFLALTEKEAAFNCVVADVKMPGMSGVDLMLHLQKNPGSPAVILVTGHGDIDMAVMAIKAGAFDFLEKPFDEIRLLECIRQAVSVTEERRAELAHQSAMRLRITSLPKRQREVMDLAISGLSNKEIAHQLKISPRTVEGHRAWVMQRLGARNLAELIRMVMASS